MVGGEFGDALGQAGRHAEVYKHLSLPVLIHAVEGALDVIDNYRRLAGFLILCVIPSLHPVVCRGEGEHEGVNGSAAGSLPVVVFCDGTCGQACGGDPVGEALLKHFA